MKKSPLRRVALATFVLWWTPVILAAADASVITLSGQAMGTTWRVLVAGHSIDVPQTTLRAAIADEIEFVEASMSHWRKNSELSRFNASDSAAWIPVSEPLAAVIQESLRIHKLTEGAFDITIAPLLELWGFGPNRRESVPEPPPPNADQIRSVKERANANRVELDRSAPTEPRLRKRNPNLQIDLSAIAKGYAIDSVDARLAVIVPRAQGWLIELGGELRARGRSHRGRVWRVGLESPDERRVGAVRGAVELRDQSIATSGVYRNFRRDSKSGQRQAHIIDPGTGAPIAHNTISVSVVAPSAMTADALATALLAMTPEDAQTFAGRHRLAATIVRETDGKTTEWSTPSFNKLRR